MRSELLKRFCIYVIAGLIVTWIAPGLNMGQCIAIGITLIAATIIQQLLD